MKNKKSPIFFQNTAKSNEMKSLKFFKTTSKRRPRDSFKDFINLTQDVREIFSNYFKTETKKDPENISN